MTTINYEINSKENIYFYIKLFVSIVMYALMLYGIISLISIDIPPQFYVFIFYAVIIFVFVALRLGLLIGYLKGNAVRITEFQFPDIHEIVVKQSAALGLPNTPHVYLLQAGGLLNAFATRFMGTNYVVIYSDVLEEAYENNLQTVEFIIGHELGHVKRKHVMKRVLLFPSVVIPFLGSAYSRACEFTCDNIGAALSPHGARNGLMVLVSGKRLYKKVNVEKFMNQHNREDGFWSWLSEKVSSHPMLSKRVMQFRGDEYAPVKKIQSAFTESIDHNAYLPKN